MFLRGSEKTVQGVLLNSNAEYSPIRKTRKIIRQEMDRPLSSLLFPFERQTTRNIPLLLLVLRDFGEFRTRVRQPISSMVA